jgi:hypothetical protein
VLFIIINIYFLKLIRIKNYINKETIKRMSNQTTNEAVEHYTDIIILNIWQAYDRFINRDNEIFRVRYNDYLRQRRVNTSTTTVPFSRSREELFDDFFGNISNNIGSQVVNSINQTHEYLFGDASQTIPEDPLVLERQHAHFMHDIENGIINNIPHPELLQSDNKSLYSKRVIIYTMLIYYVMLRRRKIKFNLQSRIEELFPGINSIPNQNMTSDEIWHSFMLHIDNSILYTIGYHLD